MGCEARSGGGGSHHNTKAPAIQKAKRIAKSAELGQVVVRKENNRIQTAYTYGQDPKRRRG